MDARAGRVEGAQSAAAAMTSALGSERMFADGTRHDLLQAIAIPDQGAQLIADYDDQYRPFAERLGLDTEGHPPAGAQCF
ncbi:hypothetical protein [Streptomyces adustus]